MSPLQASAISSTLEAPLQKWSGKSNLEIFAEYFYLWWAFSNCTFPLRWPNKFQSRTKRSVSPSQSCVDYVLSIPADYDKPPVWVMLQALGVRMNSNLWDTRDNYSEPRSWNFVLPTSFRIINGFKEWLKQIIFSRSTTLVIPKTSKCYPNSSYNNSAQQGKFHTVLYSNTHLWIKITGPQIFNSQGKSFSISNLGKETVKIIRQYTYTA